MSLATNFSGNDFSILPPEPGLTAQEVLARAEAISPNLVGRQGETEERTFYALDTHEAFRKAGFYRLLVPRRFGGYEFGIDTFLRVVIALTRGCPSTGWMYCLGAAHALAVGTLFDERAQEEIFAGGDFICPATIVPNGTAERRGDEGWVLNGTWGYCSGSPYATYFMGHTLVTREEGGEPSPMLFILPRSQWRRLDDWGRQMGLKGTGSHSIKVEDGFVPDHLTIGRHMSEVDVSLGTPGRELHGNPLYGGGQLSFMIMEDAALMIGMAKGALDAYEDLMRNRTTLFPPIVDRVQDPDFQYRYGEAAGMIAAGEAALMQAVQQWTAFATEGPQAVTRERELRIAAICHEVFKLGWGAVERYLFPTAGSSAVRRGERMERVWRDMSMFHTHAGVSIYLATNAKRELAKARFGID